MSQQQESIQTTYVIHPGPDGIFWVSLQPLLNDIDNQLSNPFLLEETLYPLHAVRTFIQSLIHEGTQQTVLNTQDNQHVH